MIVTLGVLVVFIGAGAIAHRLAHGSFKTFKWLSSPFVAVLSGAIVVAMSYGVSNFPDSEVPSVRRNLQSWGANCSSEKPETHILVRFAIDNSAIFVFQPQDTKYSDYFTIERVPSTRAKTFVTEGQPYVIVRESGDVLRCRWSWWWWVQHNHSEITHEFHIPAGGLKH